MTEKQTQYYQEIQDALEQLESVCSALSHENKVLRRRVSTLETTLEIESKKSVSPVAIDENHRTALKHQLASYLKRLDAILEKT